MHHRVVLWVSTSLPGLPSSLHPSERFNDCFTWNVQGFQFYALEVIGGSMPIPAPQKQKSYCMTFKIRKNSECIWMCVWGSLKMQAHPGSPPVLWLGAKQCTGSTTGQNKIRDNCSLTELSLERWSQHVVNKYKTYYTCCDGNRPRERAWSNPPGAWPHGGEDA